MIVNQYFPNSAEEYFTSTNLMQYGELVRTQMTIHRKCIIIKYWIKILFSKRNSLMFKTYYMLKVDVDRNLTEEIIGHSM